MSTIYTTVHGNAVSLTHWARPGIEPASSRILVGFVSTVPWQEFQYILELVYFMPGSFNLLITYRYLDSYPFPLPTGTTSLFSGSVILFLFSLLDSTYKWYHTAIVFLWFFSLSVTPFKSTHVTVNGKMSFFLELHGILLCLYITSSPPRLPSSPPPPPFIENKCVLFYLLFSPPLHLAVSLRCLLRDSYNYQFVCHLLIHLPVDGHLGCSYGLAVVNRAAINIGVHVAFTLVGYFLDICTEWNCWVIR